MKKKQFTSKLQLQKITVVSFNAMKQLKGGMLQNGDTRILSVDGYTCLVTYDCVTRETEDNACASLVTDLCTRPTTRSGVTDFCGDDTKNDCLISRKC